MKVNQIDQVIQNLSDYQQVQKASDILHRRLSLALILNCSYALITLFSSSYYVIRPSSKDPFKIGFDVIYVIETLFRLVFICYSADSISSSVRFSF